MINEDLYSVAPCDPKDSRANKSGNKGGITDGTTTMRQMWQN